MKDTRTTSPFSALTQQEQMEKWICWQSQKQTAIMPTQEKPTDQQNEPKSVPDVPEQTESRLLPSMLHHGQYNAVLKRMYHAKQRAGDFHACSD